VWTFSRSDRLADLVGRCLALAEYLGRSRCDARHDPALVRAIDRRLFVVGERLSRLRTARRYAKMHEQAMTRRQTAGAM
jgi:hypothetical protein